MAVALILLAGNKKLNSVHTASWVPGPLYNIARKASKTKMTTVMAARTHMNPRSTTTEATRREDFPRPSIHHRETCVSAV